MAAHDQPIGHPGGNSVPQDTDADIHLQRLLAADVEEPFFRSLIRNVKEFIHPPKLPPLELTSTPVPVKDIWGFYGGQEKRAGLTSMAIHVGVIALLFLMGTNKTVQTIVKQQISLIAPDIAPYQATVKKNPMGGGGGGGDRSPTPAEQRQTARNWPRGSSLPAVAVMHNPDPKLVMEPTLVIQPDANIPKVNLDALGDPLAKVRYRFERHRLGRRNRDGQWRRRGIRFGRRFGPGHGGGHERRRV